MSLDILIAIAHDLFVGIAADEIRDFFRKLLEGDDPSSLMAGNGHVASSLMHSFASAGIDPSLMSDNDWSHLAALVMPE